MLYDGLVVRDFQHKLWTIVVCYGTEGIVELALFFV